VICVAFAAAVAANAGCGGDLGRQADGQGGEVVVGLAVVGDFASVSMTDAHWQPEGLNTSVDELRGGKKFSGTEKVGGGKRIRAVAAIDRSANKVELVVESNTPFRLMSGLGGVPPFGKTDGVATEEIPAGAHTFYYKLGKGDTGEARGSAGTK